MTKNIILSQVHPMVSVEPVKPLVYRLPNDDTGSFPGFSFFGSLFRKRIYQSRGFEKYFAELDYVKNFGFWDQIPEPYQFYVKQCVLFLCRRKAFFLQETVKNTLKGSFQYVLKSDVLRKTLLVEHRFESFQPDQSEKGAPFDLWVHYCSVKEEIIPGADPVPFIVTLYSDGRRQKNLELMLHKHLSEAFRKCSPAFRGKSIKVKTLKVGASGT